MSATRLPALARFGLALAGLAAGCLYTGDGTSGLPCNTDVECGGTQRCVARICGGAQGTDSVASTAAPGEDSSSSVDPDPTSADEVRTACEASETECVQDDVLRLCTDDGKLATRGCSGWCGEASPHNGCQRTPAGDATCFCLNARAPCDEPGALQCDGDNILQCEGEFWQPYDCDTVCIEGGFAGGAESCGVADDGALTCFCIEYGCEAGAARCTSADRMEVCVDGAWQRYACDELECPAGTYSRGCTYFPGDTESCGCWPEA